MGLNPLNEYAGVPADDRLWPRIERCCTMGGVPPHKLQQAFDRIGLAEVSLKKIKASKTVRELDGAIIKKLDPVFRRLAERSKCSVMWIGYGYAAGRKFVPEWMPQVEE